MQLTAVACLACNIDAQRRKWWSAQEAAAEELPLSIYGAAALHAAAKNQQITYKDCPKTSFNPQHVTLCNSSNQKHHKTKQELYDGNQAIH